MKKIIALFLVLLLTGCTNGGILSRNPKIFITAIELSTKYEESKSTAMGDYNDKYIQITGVTSYISETEDEILIQIYGGIVCSVTKRLDDFDDLQAHNKVVLNGTVEGLDETDGKVLVNKCNLVEVITEPEFVTTAIELEGLETADVEYKVVEITGELFYVEAHRFSGWSFVTDDPLANLYLVFDHEEDLTGFEDGDTITIIGIVVTYRDFTSYSKYKLFDCELK